MYLIYLYIYKFIYLSLENQRMDHPRGGQMYDDTAHCGSKLILDCDVVIKWSTI